MPRYLGCSGWQINNEVDDCRGFMDALRSSKSASLPWLISPCAIEPTFETPQSYSKMMVLTSSTLLRLIFKRLLHPRDRGSMSRCCKRWAQLFYLKRWQYDVTLTRKVSYGRLITTRTSHNFVKVVSKRCLCYKTPDLVGRQMVHAFQMLGCPYLDEDLEPVSDHIVMVDEPTNIFIDPVVRARAAHIANILVFAPTEDILLDG